MKKSALLATTLLLSGTGLAAAQTAAVCGWLTPPPAAPAKLTPVPAAPAPAVAPDAAPTEAAAATSAEVAAPAPSVPGGSALSKAWSKLPRVEEVFAKPVQSRVTEDGNVMPCPEATGLAFWSGQRCWLHADYLLWWTKQGPNETALLTTGSDLDNTPGAIGQPRTKDLFGPGPLNYGTTSGLQIIAGGWLNPEQSCGLELRGYALEQKTKNGFFFSNADGDPFLLRPFFNAQSGAEDVAIVAFPGLIKGRAQFTNETQFWGTEANVLCGWLRGVCGRVDGVFGFRYMQLNEKLRVDEDYAPLDVEDNEIAFGGQSFAFPDKVRVFDQFRVRNQFFGPQAGVRAELNFGKCYVDARAMLAMGATHSKVMVDGGSFLLDENGKELASLTGGLLALKSNIGGHTSDGFTVVPSVILTTGCHVTESICVHVGYSFMYWSNLLRPGDQIDRVIDPRMVPTFQQFSASFDGTRPQQPLKHTDFWAQGLEFGVEIRY